ncbi:peptidoglycan-N-acetylmuramate O-acetyltransferase [Granulicatella balaenopterae]|uniref:Peptidoglycan-N-acetylmuramate O-acetyltransferase n=2 Tax=Granulicatella balaenopterae TaxID=137733 RepID=A0A1H9GRU4_9LACT|nr:peptidoglycan-N-acetylmuramate O-acetyltransferase [Granulicatella balaenopterae]
MEKRKYVPGLDGLRGLAILFIILYQLIPYEVPGGFLGINVLLILSGYLITNSMMQSLMNKARVPLKSFLTERLLRIIKPLFWMCTIVTSYITLFQRELLANLRASLASSLLFVNNWWQIFAGQSYFEGVFSQSPFTHLWYLSMSLQLYIVWPILFVLVSTIFTKLSDIKKAVASLMMISFVWMMICYGSGGDPSRVFYGTDTRFYTFLIGAMTALIWPIDHFDSPIPQKDKKRFLYGSVCSMVIVWCGVHYMNSLSVWTYRGGMLVFDLAIAVLIMTGLHTSALTSLFFRFKVFTWLGKRSYSYYLWYFPVIVLYQATFHDMSAMPWMHVFIQVVMIAVISEGWYQLFEKRNRLVAKDQDSGRGFTNWQQHLTKAIKKPKEHHFYLAKTALASIILILAVVGFFQSTTEVAQAVDEVKNRIEQNQLAANETLNTNRTVFKTINNIEGLTREETVFNNTTKTTMFGDSVLLSIFKDIEKVYPNGVVDARIERQLYQSMPEIKQLTDKKLMNSTVIVSLGTNGAFTFSQAEEFIKKVGMDKQIFFITTTVPKIWQQQVNHTIYRLADKYSNVYVIDWYTYSKDHPEWFFDNQVLPNDVGSNEMSILIAKEVYKTLKKD